MTLKEVCSKYGYSENTVKSKFSTVQAKILKDKGIYLTKTGRGANVVYHEEIRSDNRALTMFQEPPHDIFMTSDLSLFNWDFHIFLAIVTTPMATFRGTIDQLLEYMAVPITDANKQKASEAIQNLINKELIGYWVDPTDKDYFSLMIYHKVELEMRISYRMITICKEIAENMGERKRSWIPLLKTWLGVQMLEDQQPYTVAELQALTGLSAYQIRECNKALQHNEIYRTTKAYAAFNKCLGTNVDLNAFYND